MLSVDAAYAYIDSRHALLLEKYGIEDYYMTFADAAAAALFRCYAKMLRRC